MIKMIKKIIDEIHGWWLTLQIMRNKELTDCLRQAKKEIEEGEILVKRNFLT